MLTGPSALFPLQQIDEMLAGSFTVEDEDAILAELDAITQVSLK